MAHRITWMTSNLGSYGACGSIQTPPLVITRINYHPATTSEFPDSNDQEFIEITNNGDKPVTLTGFYFSGTGFVFQFPAGSILQAGGIIQLANNLQTFQQRYGYRAFGEFTRNLSREGQTLTLADGFGNVIDQVHYLNESPWPDADGNGMYLKLSDPDQDNSDGSNWIASSEPIESNVTIVAAEEDVDMQVLLYPNPSDGQVEVKAKSRISSLKVTDLQGRSLEVIPVDSNSYMLNIGHYAKGVYFVSVQLADKAVTKKLIRK